MSDMTQRMAPTTLLEPGEHSCDRSTVVEATRDGRPTFRLNWAVRLHSGEIYTTSTESTKSKAECRRKAKRKAERLLKSGGQSKWKGSTPIEKFLDEISATEIEEAGLAVTSQRRYRGLLALIRGRLRGHTISSALRHDVLKTTIVAITAEHGAGQGEGSRNVLSRYVVSPALWHRVIDRNPLEGVRIDYQKYAPPATRPKRGGKALTVDEQERIVTWLLTLDPADGVTVKKRGRLDQAIRKRELAIAITLIQAGTGMRVSEVVKSWWSLLQTDDAGQMFINIPKEVAKTKKARRTPIFDPRIQAWLQTRLEQVMGDPDALARPLVGAPADLTKRWRVDGSGGASSNIKDLYLKMAEKLDIPLLGEGDDLAAGHRSHVWRTTLNARLSEAGVGREDRAAMLGHDKVENERSYTDRTDTSAAVSAYRDHFKN